MTSFSKIISRYFPFKIGKKWLKIILSVYLLGLVYLIFPGPIIPDLPDSFRSLEPGDNWQIPGVSAYYTNLSRQEVTNFYRSHFSRSFFFNIPIFTYRLNHPPEYVRETIHDTLNSTFYEELVHPLRESLFINGWAPSEDVMYKRIEKDPQKRAANFLEAGQTYQTKITLYYVSPPLWARILVWTGVVGAMTILALATISVFKSPWLIKR